MILVPLKPTLVLLILTPLSRINLPIVYNTASNILTNPIKLYSNMPYRPSKGTINSKCNQEVRIVQRWNGIRPPINYLRDYRIWLVAEKIKEKMQESMTWSNRNTHNNTDFHNSSTNTIPWIEKLLQTSIADHRKYAIWRILIPYLFNVKNLSEIEVFDITEKWLNKCDEMRALDFNVHSLISQNIRNSKSHRFLPISHNKLCSENQGLYDIVSQTMHKHSEYQR